ncbi:MAG: hypothetical protein ACK5HY_06710 [Parahaliea sp.]
MEQEKSFIQPEVLREQEAFRAHMAGQCREIRKYRIRVMRTERRWLTLDEAAEEWIARYAEEYARLRQQCGCQWR